MLIGKPLFYPASYRCVADYRGVLVYTIIKRQATAVFIVYKKESCTKYCYAFKKKFVRTLLILITAVICAISASPINASAATQSLYLGGFSAGFNLSTTTVEVIAFATFSHQTVCVRRQESAA